MGVWLIALLALGAILPMMTNVSAQVDYSVTITDPSGDTESMSADQEFKDNADIVEVTSSEAAGTVTLAMVVHGTVMNTSTGTSYTFSWKFDLDIDDDHSWDWTVQVTATSYAVSYTLTVAMYDDTNEHILPLSSEHISGFGTDQLTVQFPLNYITGNDTVSAWDIAGETSHVATIAPLGMSASDAAPDGGLGDDGTGDDDDDDDDDTGDDGDQNGTADVDEQILITITDPTEGQTIEASDSASATYTAEGTVSPPTGEVLQTVEYRIVGTSSDTGWQSATDESADWTAWSATFSTYWYAGYGTLESGGNTLEVRATLTNNDHNTDTVNFVFDTSTAGGGDDDDDDDDDQDDIVTDGDDPAEETPTDTSISVSITDISYQYEERGDTIHMEMSIKGTTGGVDHCKLAMVTYDQHGNVDGDVIWFSEFDISESSQYQLPGVTTAYFKATAPDWYTWEYKIVQDVDKSDWEDGDSNDTDDEPGKVSIFVRAFGDAAEEDWNQASREITPESIGSSDSNGSPGFEALALIAAVALFAIIAVARRHQ